MYGEFNALTCLIFAEDEINVLIGAKRNHRPECRGTTKAVLYVFYIIFFKRNTIFTGLHVSAFKGSIMVSLR